MAKPSQRIFGMSRTQAGILAGLGLLAFFSVCGVAALIFFNSPASVPSGLPPAASATPEIWATPAATETPAASPTPAATEFVPPAGWKQFSNSQLSLWLPESFVGGDMRSGREASIAEVQALGDYFGNMVTIMQNAGPTYSLLMVDKNLDSSIIITSVSAQHEAVGQDISLGEYIRLTLSNSSLASITINEQLKVTVLGLEARRMTYQYRMGTSESTNISYTIKDGRDFWTITYSLPPQKYPELLTMVEQSIATLQILKP
ncbi:MAG: hypothetical protein OHK0031_16090 [Anaerolineales bacterium]